MKKNFVVIGLGTFGFSVAKALAEKNQEVIAIDKNEQLVNEISDFVTKAVSLDATDEKAIKSIGIEDVDAAIIGVGDIEESILIALLLKEIGVKKIIAKAISDEHKKVLEKIGIDKIILPEREVAENLINTLVSPKIFEQIQMSDKYSLIEIIPPKDWLDKTIKEADIRNKYDISIVGIRRKFPHIDDKGDVTEVEDFIIAPPASTKILKNDILIVIGDKEAIEKLNKSL